MYGSLVAVGVGVSVGPDPRVAVGVGVGVPDGGVGVGVGVNSEVATPVAVAVGIKVAVAVLASTVAVGGDGVWPVGVIVGTPPGVPLPGRANVGVGTSGLPGVGLSPPDVAVENPMLPDGRPAPTNGLG